MARNEWTVLGMVEVVKDSNTHGIYSQSNRRNRSWFLSSDES